MLRDDLEGRWVDADPSRGSRGRKRRRAFGRWVDGACGGFGLVLFDFGVEEVSSVDWPSVLCGAFV